METEEQIKRLTERIESLEHELKNLKRQTFRTEVTKQEFMELKFDVLYYYYHYMSIFGRNRGNIDIMKDDFLQANEQAIKGFNESQSEYIATLLPDGGHIITLKPF